LLILGLVAWAATVELAEDPEEQDPEGTEEEPDEPGDEEGPDEALQEDMGTLEEVQTQVGRGHAEAGTILTVLSKLEAKLKKELSSIGSSMKKRTEAYEKDIGSLAREKLELAKMKESDAKTQATIVRELEMLASIRQMVKQLQGVKAGSTKNYCWVNTGAATDIRTSSWTSLNDINYCEFESSGNPVKVTMDFSVYGIHHGGVRLLMDDKTPIGGDPTYGFDWVIPAVDNSWYKRHLTRVVKVPAGKHRFLPQIRGQGSSSRIYVHGGTPSAQYSGFWMLMQEMDPTTSSYVQKTSGFSTATGSWVDVPGAKVTLQTTGGDVRAAMDMSVHGIHHGGIRLLMDNSVRWGKNTEYGFDWLVAEVNNRWQKRNLIRVLTGVPAGKHTFQLQVKSQSPGSTLTLHSGQGGSTYAYSGIWLVMEEIPNSKPHVAYQCGQGLDYRSASWKNLCSTFSIKTTGKPVVLTLDFSVYGNTHGGIRAVMDGKKVFGTQETYGFDWVIHTTNQWQKRTITRVLTGIPAGKHSFQLQIRNQGGSSQIYVHSGNPDQNYSGMQVDMRELA